MYIVIMYAIFNLQVVIELDINTIEDYVIINNTVFGHCYIVTCKCTCNIHIDQTLMTKGQFVLKLFLDMFWFIKAIVLVVYHLRSVM